MPAYFVLAVAIIAEVIGTSAMKASAGFSRIGPSVVTLVGFSIAFFCLSSILDRIPLGTAYAIWAGSGIVLVAIVGWVIYGQRPDAAGFVGMTLILVGVLVLNLLSKTTAH
jgi:multidrug transporter EmrE-like cation transporter